MATIIRSFGFVLSACHSLLVKSSSQSNVENEIKSLEDDLKWVEGILTYAKSVIADAEERAVCGEKLVQKWLADIQRLAYRASDLIRVYEYEVIAQEIRHRERERKKASSSTMALTGNRKYVQVHNYPSSPLMDAKFREEFARSVSNLRKDMDEVNALKETFCFDIEDVELKKPAVDFDFEHRDTVSTIVGDDLFVGRDKSMQDLIRLLLTDGVEENDDSSVPVIALVGMGGVGKTTLAQHVFNDSDVCGNYSMRGWVYVSNDFEPQRLTKSTFEALTHQVMPNCEELSTLQGFLANVVRENKFLLVLDDVWNEEVELWDTFYSSLRHGAKGSKIIVTTRSHEVAIKMRPLRCIEVGCLSEENSRALFQIFAYKDYSRTEIENPQLVDIGKQIADKCNGLPLAIKVLGRSLFGENHLDIWRHVLGPVWFPVVAT